MAITALGCEQIVLPSLIRYGLAGVFAITLHRVSRKWTVRVLAGRPSSNNSIICLEPIARFHTINQWRFLSNAVQSLVGKYWEVLGSKVGLKKPSFSSRSKGDVTMAGQPACDCSTDGCLTFSYLEMIGITPTYAGSSTQAQPLTMLLLLS